MPSVENLSNNADPFFLLAIVGFHEKIGHELEFCYPEIPDNGTQCHIPCNILKEYLHETLPFLALPDRHEAFDEDDLYGNGIDNLSTWSNHENAGQSIFFNVNLSSPSLCGVSCFMQKNIELEEESSFSRGKIQKSIVVLTNLPFQTWIELRLRAFTHDYFVEGNFKDTKKLLHFYQILLQTNFSRFDMIELYVNLPVVPLLRSLGRDLIIAMRAVLLGGRVMFYSCFSHRVSAAVLALCSLIPGILSQNFVSHAFQVKEYRLHQFGMPLQVFHERCVLEPYVVAQCIDKLYEYEGFLAGTSNSMLPLLPKAKLDVLVDLDSNEVIVYDTLRSNAAVCVGPGSSAFAESIAQKTRDTYAKMIGTQGEGSWDGSVGWIRAQFQLYFESFLTTSAESLANANDEQLSFFSKLQNYAVDSIFSVRAAPRPSSEMIAHYGEDFFIQWQETKSFQTWKNSHKIKESNRKHPEPPMSGTYHYVYENGDRYEGNFLDRQRDGFGVYIEYSTGNKYEGQFRLDIRHGKGILTCPINGMVYDGEWCDNKRTGKGVCHLRSGEMYEGGWLNSLFHGRGKHIDVQGNEYDGEWSHGLKHGIGLEIKVGLDEKYNGEWVKGKKCGIGTFTFADGSIYSGNWRDSKRCGEGTLLSVNGDKYEGQWLNDKPHGYGKIYIAAGDSKEGEMVNGKPKDSVWTIEYRNGDRFTGDCRSGRPWGNGVLKYCNGDVYSGQFIDGLREGEGICVFAKGDIFEGIWSNNMPMRPITSPVPFGEILLNETVKVSDHSSKAPSPNVISQEEEESCPPQNGEHDFIYPSSGDRYIGSFKNHQRHGRGNYMQQSSGNVYEGEWVEDKRHGKGVLTSGSKDFIYDGDWVMDVRSGYGKCVICSRETYVGEWLENQFHGRGKYIDADGNVYEGEWHCGRKHGVGKITMTNGESYNGEWKFGHRNGIGTCSYSDGSVYSGSWIDDERCGEGIFTQDALGIKFEGQWLKDMRHGSGILVESCGTVREGEWKMDQPLPTDSEWSITFTNGSKFTGTCRNGKPFGYGVCKYENGDVYSGSWEHGNRQGFGVCIFAKGETFEGDWKDNHIAVNGKGKLTLADGTVHKYHA